MKKILLMRPSAPNILSKLHILDCEPLELEYLHTIAAQHGWEDLIFDGHHAANDSLEKTLASFQPDVVAITGYITQEKRMLQSARIAKEVLPGVVTIIGGVHAQLNYQRFYGPEVDYVFRSEDVNAFGDLLQIIAGEENGLERINGLCYRHGDKWHGNELQPFNMDDLPIPDRSYFYQNKSQFRYLEFEGVALLKTALSCPSNCNFCYCTLLGCGRYTARSLDKVMQELSQLDTDTVFIVDDDFLVNEEKIWSFISEVKRLGIRKNFLCYARADYIAAHPEQIKALAEIGFTWFFVGLEAITDQELVNYNKRVTAEMNTQCLKVIKDAGSRCFGLMIAPLEATRQHFEDIYRWVVDHELTFVTVSIFTAVPGTPLYEEYKDRLITDDIEEWDFLHLHFEPPHMSRQAFYYEYFRLSLRLFNMAYKKGGYDYMDFAYYKRTFRDYFRNAIWAKR